MSIRWRMRVARTVTPPASRTITAGGTGGAGPKISLGATGADCAEDSGAEGSCCAAASGGSADTSVTARTTTNNRSAISLLPPPSLPLAIAILPPIDDPAAASVARVGTVSGFG